MLRSSQLPDLVALARVEEILLRSANKGVINVGSEGLPEVPVSQPAIGTTV
jgi:hypothetical protein